MKDLKKMSFSQLREKRLEVNEQLGDLYTQAANRKLNAEEEMQEINLNRELSQIEEQMKFIACENENKKNIRENAAVVKAAKFREMLKDIRNGRADREILLYDTDTNITANIEASGAIYLTIRDIIPTLNEGTGLPVGLNLTTGVIGNEVWPVSINDVELEEVGEVASLNDQTLDFAQITATPMRVGATVPVSNMAIDNAAFDLMAFVQTKFGVALKKYLAEKIYSQAGFTGNHGPFSNLTATDIELGDEAFENILAAVADFTDKGFDPDNVCLVMDAVTEAELKATPKIAGAAGGFVIENGKCAGYNYVVSHYINTTLSDSNLVATQDRYIGIGYWEYFAVQQHGNVRLTVDATSQGVAKKNITAITLNTAWSMTDLSVHINGGDPQTASGITSYPTQAFALYKVVASTGSGV